jgi:hypothetical protein
VLYPLYSGMWGRRMRKLPEGGYEIGPNVPHSMQPRGFERDPTRREWFRDSDKQRVAEHCEESYIKTHPVQGR